MNIELTDKVLTIQRQLMWTVDIATFFSWGVNKMKILLFRDMPTLGINVSGLQHKGWVYISLNEGLDLYEITLLTSNYRVLKTIDEVYCDQLAQIVDELVERSPGMTDAEYANAIQLEELKRLGVLK